MLDLFYISRRLLNKHLHVIEQQKCKQLCAGSDDAHFCLISCFRLASSTRKAFASSCCSCWATPTSCLAVRRSCTLELKCSSTVWRMSRERERERESEREREREMEDGRGGKRKTIKCVWSYEYPLFITQFITKQTLSFEIVGSSQFIR